MYDGDDLWLMEGDVQLMKTSELVVSGLHNAVNSLAALAMCRSVGVAIDPLSYQLCANFAVFPIAVEKVAAFNEVTFYDDSKSTNVGSPP
jgi:UDP-N-acetylmuramoylalanine--D-glutamate ligase